MRIANFRSMMRFFFTISVLLVHLFVLSTADLGSEEEEESPKYIKVQTDIYVAPYDNEPLQVATILRTKKSNYKDPFDEANWYLDLGLAHRTIVEERKLLNGFDDDDNRSSSSSPEDNEEEEEKVHILKSIHAYQAAVEIYNGMLLAIDERQFTDNNDNNDDDDDDDDEVEQQAVEREVVDHHLAAAFFQMGESYSLSQQYKDLALDFYVQSHDKFSKVLNGKLDPFSKSEAELSFAHCSMRLGSTLLEQKSPELGSKTKVEGNMITLDLGDLMGGAGGGGGMEEMMALLQDPSKLEKMITENFEKLLNPGAGGGMDESMMSQLFPNVKKALGHFEKAVDIFESRIAKTRNSKDKLELIRHLATCRQNMATANAIKHNFKEASDNYEEALTLHSDNLNEIMGRNPYDDEKKNEQAIADTRMAISEALHGLADAYLQQGKYDEAKDRYRRALELIEENNIPQAHQDEFDILDTTTSLEYYEKLLQEYEDTYGDSSMDGGAGGGRILDDEHGYFQQSMGGPSVVKDDGYEGDLHASLGALYMAKGELVMAASHLEQAIRLYELSGEAVAQTMANVKLNLAGLHLRTKDYQGSVREYEEALDIYHELFGDGVNPLSMESTLKELLESEGLDLSMLTGGGFGSIFGDVGIGDALKQAFSGNFGDSLKEAMEQVSKAQADVKVSGETTVKEQTKNAAAEDDFVVKPGKSIKMPDGKMIDIDSFLHQNDSLKEEL